MIVIPAQAGIQTHRAFKQERDERSIPSLSDAAKRFPPG